MYTNFKFCFNFWRTSSPRLPTKFWSPIGLYCVNCTRFGQLILRKIIKIVANRCQIFSLKCVKFHFGWGSTQTPLGEFTALPQTTCWISGVLLLRGWEGERKKGIGKGGKGRSGEGGWDWNDATGPPPVALFHPQSLGECLQHWTRGTLFPRAFLKPRTKRQTPSQHHL